MALTKYKLGKLITLCTGGNEDLKYGEDLVKGISINKTFMETKADLSGVSLANYTVVSPKCFSFVTVTSRNGNKISIAYNSSDESFLVSSFYVTFKLSDFGKTVLLEDYLYMFFNRSEFDRYARRDSWGSAREYFYFDNICDVEINLPSLAIQQKYVDIYKAMVANQQSYERGLEDLKLVLDASLEKYKHNSKRVALSKIINEIDVRNFNMEVSEVDGVNKDKRFMPAVASGEDLSKYKIVKKNQFACNLMHVGRDEAVPIALHTNENPIIVSPAYVVFQINTESVFPQYILMWFSRTETDRNAWFMCDNNIRGGMEKKRFFEMEIPVPSIPEQSALVELFEALSLRRSINEKLKTQIKDICPILIRGSLEEGRNENV